MTNYADTVIDDLLKDFYPAPKVGAYTPTFVLGLGGTGLKVIRTLKKYLRHHSEQRVKLLGIDSDDGENRKHPDLPALEPTELCILNQDVAIRALARADAGFPDYRHIDDFLPDTFENYTGIRQGVREKIQTRKGAGQFRRAGKLLFSANVNNGVVLNNIFRDAKLELVGLQTQLAQEIAGIQIDQGIKVIVVSSIAGGTGAGILLDCIALLRQHFSGSTDVITAFMMLPGPALDKELTDPNKEIPNTRGNAMGLIRELQPIKLGEINHTFHFDKDTKFVYNATTPLVNDCYLIDNALFDHTPVDSWMELCKATGCFLYGLVGTGVGAARASGVINSPIEQDKGREAVPRIFKTFGVGVLEYPIEGLGKFGIQHVLNDLLGEWLNPKFNTKQASEKVSETLSRLGLDEVEDVRAMLNFGAESLVEGQFLKGEQTKKLALSKPDEQFISFGNAKMDSIDGELNAYNERLGQRVAEISEKNCSIIDEDARLLITGNHAFAKFYFEQLKLGVERLRLDFQKEQERRKEEFEELKNELEQLKKKINFWDFYLDLKLRKLFVIRVNDYLRHRVDNKADQYLCEIFVTVLRKLNDIYSTISNISLNLENIQSLNSNRMDSFVSQYKGLGFIQSAMDGSDCDNWLDKIKLPLKMNFVASELKEGAILREALVDAGPSLVKALSAFDLIGDAKKGADLLKRLKSLNTSSRPLMCLVPTAPSESDMTPQKLVAANIENEADPFVKNNYSAVGKGKVVVIPTGNKHMVICSCTLSGFGIAHWSEYERALKYYKEKEWYYHTFSEKLPPLEVVSGERANQLEIMGTSLMFDLIVCRGSNYYRNLVQSGDDRLFYYLTYRKEPNRFAQLLIDHKLTQQAKQSELRPRAENMMANSLEASMDALGKIDWVDFCRQVQDLRECFIATVGQVEAKKQVMAYVDEVLVEEIKSIKQFTPRRELLDGIADAMKKYADAIR